MKDFNKKETNDSNSENLQNTENETESNTSLSAFFKNVFKNGASTKVILIAATALVAIIICVTIIILSLGNTGSVSSPKHTDDTLLKGKAEYINLDNYDFYTIKDAEFEYVSNNLIKITQANGEVTYYEATEIESMRGVTFYD